MSIGTLSMANGGLTFLLLTFQYLVGWEIFNLVISKNLVRWMHVAGYQCRSPKQNNFGVNLAPVR
jgi:uncharacterized membrane protein